jgi:putative flavoprotein involved in K+ transport
MTEKIDTIIIGGGQAGLSTSYYLSLQGRDHIILEKADQAAQAWRDRWDSFTLITPNWTIHLPGAEYQGDRPDDFMVRSEVVAYLEGYAAEYDMPIEYNTQVTAVEPNGSGFRVSTTEEDFKAANVVIATGMYQRSKIPPISANISPEIPRSCRLVGFWSSDRHNPAVKLPKNSIKEDARFTFL